MSPALAILLVIAHYFLWNLTWGILFLILVSRAYCVQRCLVAPAPKASTPRMRACETTLMPSAFVDEVSAALSEAFETRTTDLPSTPSSSFDTWKSSPFSSQPTPP